MSVDRYDIATNQWSVATAMNARRAMHNANVMGDSLYVFGGIKNAAQELQVGIERLSLQGIGGGTWEYMAVTPKSGAPSRFNFLFAELGPSEMLILGGMNTEIMLGDGFILDANTKTVKQVR